MKDWIKPNKRKRKRDNFGKAKLKKRERKFGATEKKNKRDGWGGDGKSGGWGAPPDGKERTDSPRKRGNWISRMVASGRRTKRWNDLWKKHDAVENEIKRRQTEIESRVKSRSDEVSELMRSLSGKPLTGNQQVQIREYFERKKQEISETGNVVDAVIKLFGNIFGKAA